VPEPSVAPRRPLVCGNALNTMEQKWLWRNHPEAIFMNRHRPIPNTGLIPNARNVASTRPVPGAAPLRCSQSPPATLAVCSRAQSSDLRAIAGIVGAILGSGSKKHYY
jgi:hypothetical protein